MSNIRILTLVHCPDTRRVLRSALSQGWEYVQYTRSGHVEIRWPATDVRLWTGTTPSDRNSWKNFARDIELASPVKVWNKGNRKRSRKAVRPSGFSIAKAVGEQRVAAERVARGAAERHERERVAEVRAQALEARERELREIHQLMQPGWGRRR